MSSPNFDALSIKLSHLIDDPVSSATTDGNVVTSFYRTQFLNDGIRNCLRKWVIQKDWMALRNYLKDSSATLASGTSILTAWTGTPYIILAAKNVTRNVYIRPVANDPTLKYLIDVGANQYVSASLTIQYYSIENGYFTLLDGTVGGTDTINLRYVKEHSDLIVGAGASTVIYDASFSSSSKLITGFSGVSASHVGGTITGTDSGGNPFSRLITSYVGTGSVLMDSALLADGGCTYGYVTPPSQNDIEIDSQYWDEVLQEAYKIYARRYPTAKNVARIQVA